MFVMHGATTFKKTLHHCGELTAHGVSVRWQEYLEHELVIGLEAEGSVAEGSLHQ